MSWSPSIIHFSLLRCLVSNPVNFPELGFGLGLRVAHYPVIFEQWPSVDWFEIISENFMDTDGRPKRNLARIRERYPVVMHGVALSIGTVDPLNSEYLQKLKKLIDFVKPAWVSDHLCWTGIAHKNTHDLLPVPYTEEALAHIVGRIKQVQDFLERPIALENPSTYLEFTASQMPEAEFIARMVQESGCHLLLDVNNVYVSSYNHRLDPKAYIDALPLDNVMQIHLSGHLNKGTHIIDTHDDYVVDEVWALYDYVVHKAGRVVNTMVEWDDKLPPFETLVAELEKARTLAYQAQATLPLPVINTRTPAISNPTRTLKETQAYLQDAIFLDEKFDTTDWIADKNEFSSREQLAVYRNAYRYRLYDVVAEDYPVLKHYLGAKKFETALDRYIETTPSTHFNIARYAVQLPGSIDQAFPKNPMAHALALFETAIAQLHDAAETAALAPEQLTALSPESFMAMVLKPRAALQLFAFDYPVNHYYLAVKNGEKPKKPAAYPSFVAVFRHEDVVWRMDLEAQEYALLNQLFNGIPIDRALTDVQHAQSLPEDALAADLSRWFGRWMRNGLLAAG